MKKKHFAAVCLTLTITAVPAVAWAQGTYYPNCDAVRAAGRAPLHRGEPGYRSGLDADNDGKACDVGSGNTPTSRRSTPTTTKKPTATAPKAVTAKPRFTG